MDSQKGIDYKDRIVFGENEITKVADYLYDHLNDCKIFAFSGPLGAGKTTLIRELLRRSGVKERITSPTFVYVNRYKNSEEQIFYHFDLYRIERVSDFLAAGFDEYLQQPNGKVFIEWPEVIDSLLKDKCCYIMLDYYNDKRELRIKK